MKILFLHLSDAHLRENTNLSQINTVNVKSCALAN